MSELTDEQCRTIYKKSGSSTYSAIRLAYKLGSEDEKKRSDEELIIAEINMSLQTDENK